ncbi:hypothetical protein GS676_04800 [Rhodococcus hoagii]|nr:hypothetical protein [Prescottella equi]
MTILMAWGAVQSVVRHEPAMLVVAVAMTAMCVFGTVWFSSVAGFRHLRLSKRIVSARDDIGSGLSIPTRRHLISLLVGLGSTSVIGFVVAAGWFLGADVGTLAAQDRGQARFLTAGAIFAGVLFVVVLGFRSSTSIRLYPSGVRRIVTLHRLWSTRTIETFVSWDGIDEFVADEQVVGGTVEVRNPVIWLVSRTAIPEGSRRRFDAPNRARLDAHLLVAEPNVLLALLSRMRESRPLRASLAEAEAPVDPDSSPGAPAAVGSRIDAGGARRHELTAIRCGADESAPFGPDGRGKLRMWVGDDHGRAVRGRSGAQDPLGPRRVDDGNGQCDRTQAADEGCCDAGASDIDGPQDHRSHEGERTSDGQRRSCEASQPQDGRAAGAQGPVGAHRRLLGEALDQVLQRLPEDGSTRKV